MKTAGRRAMTGCSHIETIFWLKNHHSARNDGKYAHGKMQIWRRE
jgi:hypothetical protein